MDAKVKAPLLSLSVFSDIRLKCFCDAMRVQDPVEDFNALRDG
jgi:hypothetical protein